MSTPEIKPALTPKKWALLEDSGFLSVSISLVVADFINGDLEVSAPDNIVKAEDRLPLTALCLHGQPFGFTHEDVRDLEDAASRVEYEDHMQAPLAARLDDLAARIAALLPPDPAENA